jgi:sugar (pentulose or hexulose) kinase
VSDPDAERTVWIGIDLGTQSVRVVALDDAGHQLALAAEPLTSVRSGDRHEQDPAQWWSATRTALSRVTGALGGDAQVRALAISGTSGTVVPVDRDTGEARGMATMYDDRRGASQLDRVAERGADFFARLGYRMQASWALPRMLTMVQEGLPDGAVLAHQPDVISAHLAGRRLPSDLSSALKSGADLDFVGWPEELLSELGLPVARLNGVVASGSVVGRVAGDAAAETGLPVGCRIVAGMTDGCAAQIAAGALRPGSWNSVLGTTLVLKGAARSRQPDPEGVVYAHRAPFGVGWYPGGASSVGAGAISRWLPDRDLAELTAQVDRSAAAPVAYPLSGRGERFPFVADSAEAFWPAEMTHDDDVARFSAILHGVAWTERLAFDLVGSAGYDITGDVLLTGGGARNPVWNQLRADVLGRTLSMPAHSEGAAGMAVLAAAGYAAAEGDAAEGDPGGDPLGEAAARLVPEPTRIEPDLRRHGRLMEAYGRYVDVLAERGWLGHSLLAAARERAGR